MLTSLPPPELAESLSLLEESLLEEEVPLELSELLGDDEPSDELLEDELDDDSDPLLEDDEEDEELPTEEASS